MRSIYHIRQYDVMKVKQVSCSRPLADITESSARLTPMIVIRDITHNYAVSRLAMLDILPR